METMQEKRGLLSIVIPVYNAKDRLSECLQSVVAQCYNEIEVIIVDDCSTDGSLEISRKYEREYPFIHVYTKENEGVSAARNFGMRKATGKYIQFVDSDDWLEPGSSQFLMERMERDHSDIVIGSYYDEKERMVRSCPDALYTDWEDFIEAFPELYSGLFLHVPWNKLYRRGKIQAEFPEDMDKGEDLMFNLQAFSQADRISTLSESVYWYCNKKKGTLSSRFREDAMEIEERLYFAVKDFYTKKGGKELKFLFQFHMNAVKNKFYALLKAFGSDRAKCCDMIRKWLQMDSIRELYDRRDAFEGKDRILLFLMHWNCVDMLYLYYKIASGKKDSRR